MNGNSVQKDDAELERIQKMYALSIGEMLKSTPGSAIKEIIRAYDPNVTYKQNLDMISGSRFKSDDLEYCAKYLKLKTRDDNNNKIYHSKAKIADRIIMKIESYFEDECDECQQPYRNSIEDNTDTVPMRIECFLCLQGSHNCKEMGLKATIVSDTSPLPLGLVWLCRGCRLRNDLLAPTKKVRKKTPSTPSAGAQTGNSIDKEPTEKEEDEEEDEEEETREEATEQNDVEGDQSRESPRRDSPHHRQLDRNSTAKRLDKKDICPLYKKANCPHGLTGKKIINGLPCSKSHPRRCINYCRFGEKGCQKKNQCKFYHPVLCRSSVRNRTCLKEDCTFTHLKFTKRFDDKRQRPELHAKSRTKDLPAPSDKRPMPRNHIGNPRQQQGSLLEKQAQQPEARAGYTNSLDTDFLVRLIENMKQSFESKFLEIERKISIPAPPPPWPNLNLAHNQTQPGPQSHLEIPSQHQILQNYLPASQMQQLLPNPTQWNNSHPPQMQFLAATS
jgi:hypothetical protein